MTNRTRQQAAGRTVAPAPASGGMTDRQVQEALNRLGFPCGAADGIVGPLTRRATARFQVACALPGHRLAVDGIPGPLTRAALTAVADVGDRLAPHFAADELRSRGDGTCYVHRDLLHALEDMRARLGGRPVIVRSAWRDPAHNQAVGGAARSQHTFGAAPELDRLDWMPHDQRTAGRACDLTAGYASIQQVRDLEIFTGLGYRARDGWCVHVDVRVGPSPDRPTTWTY